MTWKALLTFLTTFLFLCAAISPNIRAWAHTQTIDVPSDFSSIQAAINNATDGEIIFVHKGTYNENIVVNKSVTLLGEDVETTVIDGNGSGTSIRVSAESVSLKNLTIRGGGSNAYESGIFVESSSSNITDNIIIGNGLIGICLNKSSNAVISGNVVKQNKGDGIVLLYSSNDTLNENTIIGNNFGIHAYSSNRNTILNNTLIENTLGGINLFYSSSNRLISNNLTSNNGSGIILDYSSDNNTVIDNTVAATEGYGLVIASSTNNILRSNNLTGNTYNFYCQATRPNLSDFLNDIDTSNTANDRPIYYFVNRQGLLIDEFTFTDIGYLALINCTNITVQGINFSQNGQGLLLAFTNNTVVKHVQATRNNLGIKLMTSVNNTITNNTLLNNNEDGIMLDYSSNENIVAYNTIENSSNGIRMVHHIDDNHIIGNTITNNTIGLSSYSFNVQNTIENNIITNNVQGISMFRACNNNTLTQNTIADNAEGLYLDVCSQNSIFNNNFINNTIHVTSPNSTNAWDNGYPNGGNYWSNYTGVDANHDGIGDVAYVVDSDNVDDYPLTGIIRDFEVTTENHEVYDVQVVSNSTVSNLALLWWLSSSNQYIRPGQKYICFSVNGESDTTGFCRVLIPRSVLNGTYVVLVDWQEVRAMEISGSNSTHAYIYFTYEHSVHEVVIIPEFSSAFIVLLFAAVTLTFVASGRKHSRPAAETGCSKEQKSTST
jgi:parallel beta-helix repeat protein